MASQTEKEDFARELNQLLDSTKVTEEELAAQFNSKKITVSRWRKALNSPGKDTRPLVLQFLRNKLFPVNPDTKLPTGTSN